MDHIDVEKKKIWNPLAPAEVTKLLDTFIEIKLKQEPDRNFFNLIRETLKRVGILKRNKLYQTAHLLYKKDRYYIVHFKQLFSLDGRENTMDELDHSRTRKIAYLICKKWNLADVVDESLFNGLDENSGVFVNVIRHQDILERKIELCPKYRI